MTNDPNAEPFLCPADGTSSEDMRDMGTNHDGEQVWQCPTCERFLTDDELVAPWQYDADRKYDRQAD
jgi:hypothetical protein